MSWIDVDEEMPVIGQKVILFANGVVQEEIYMLDAFDNDLYNTYYWSRDDLEDCPFVKSGQLWMPLPEPPKDE